MEIRWTELTKSGDSYMLTIEGSVKPRDVYSVVRSNTVYNSLLIAAYDMEDVNFSPLASEFADHEIEATETSSGLLVENAWIPRVFDETAFGESQDRYMLLTSHGSLSLAGQKDLIVDYRNIPDLVITCKNQEYLKRILDRLSSMVS